MTLSPNIRTLTVKFVEAGATVNDLASLFATQPTIMRSRLRMWGLKATPATKKEHKPRPRRIRRPCTKFDERNKQMCEMYVEGRTLEEVAAPFNITRERVRQVLVKNGITERWTSRREKRASDKVLTKQIMTRYLEGMTIPEAAKHLGIKRSTLRMPLITVAQRTIHRIAQFWRLVEKQTESHPELGTPCWLWTGGKNEITGYGRYRFASRLDSTHRIAYTLVKGKPVNWVLHWCDNGLCVNPDHLYDGTAKENARDRDRNGHKSSILNFEKAQEIRQQLNLGVSYTDVAQTFDVSPTTIWKVQKNQRWTVDRSSRNEEKIRKAWACKGKMTAQAAHELTNIAVRTIYNIWGGYTGNNITGLPHRSRGLRITRQITWNGQTRTVKEWATSLNMEPASLRYRLRRMSLEAALTTPKK